MFGSIGGYEVVFILALALLLFGPRKLPEIGRTLARTLSEFRKATHEFRSGLEQEIEVEKMKEARETLDSTAQDVNSTVENLASVPREPSGADRPEKATDTPSSSPSSHAGQHRRT